MGIERVNDSDHGDNRQTMTHFNVNQYPTLRLYKDDGQFTEYIYNKEETNLKQADLLAWLEENGIKAGGAYGKPKPVVTEELEHEQTTAEFLADIAGVKSLDDY